jgi:hypothetical protein
LTPYYIIGAADFKLTAGDVTFEPPTSKVRVLGWGVAALIAGDIDVQLELCARVAAKAPGTVREAVSLYGTEIASFNVSRAESSVLSKYGMTMRDFVDNQHNMTSHFVEELRVKMEDAQPRLQTIVCGVDGTGPQLYYLDANGSESRHTEIGFSGIGDGGRHAESQFMFAKYTPTWLVEQSLVLLYSAKKRAEVAPGVGQTTNMFYIDGPRGVQPLNETLVRELERAYDEILETENVATKKAVQRIKSYFDSFNTQKAPPKSRGKKTGGT